MKVRAETRDLANLKWALEVACLWWEPEQMSAIQKVLHWLNMMNFTMFTLLINMALARIPVVAILYKPYAPLTLWYNAMYFSVVFLQFKSRQIILFHRGMVKLLARYSSEEQMDRFLYLTGIVWKFAFFMAASLISGICIQSLPIFIDILLALFTDSGIFYVPFLMEGFLPEKKERSIWLSVLNFFNVVTQIGPLTYFACYIIMLPAVVSLVYFVLEVVENKLRLWDSLSPQHPERKAIFRELVEEHVEALRLLELMKSAFAPCYCMQCLLLSYNVGYFAHLAKMAMKRSDVGVAVTEIYMATICVIGVVISNAIGQILFEKGLEVSRSIYNLNWMAKSTAEQHDLQMVMRKAQIPVVIAFKNTLPLNFYTLTDMKVRAETRDLANLKWALEAAGLWWEPEQMSGIQKVLHWLKMMNFTMFILLINMAIARIPVVAIPYKPYAPLTLWFNAMYFSVVFLLLKSRQIVLFHHGMVKLLARYSSEAQIDRFLYLTGIVWKFAFFMTASLLSGIFIETIPGFIDVLLALFTDSEIFYVPFLMEGFLPEKKERSIWLYFLTFFNVVTQIGPLTYFACYICMLPAAVSLVYFVLEVVENKLRLWDSLSPQHPERKTIFRELVEEHVEALRLLELMKSAFAPCYCMQCLILSYNVGYYAHFAKMAMKRSDVGVAVTEIYMATICVIGVVISNTIGQILFEKGLEVSRSIYNLNWMAKSTAEQRDLQMVMRKAQIPVVIAFKNTLPLNLYTLTDMINRSYTLFMVLGTIQTE